MTDLTPDTIAQIRNRAENVIKYGGRQMTFHPTEVIALLDTVETAGRVEELAEHFTGSLYDETEQEVARQILALLRGKENEA